MEDAALWGACDPQPMQQVGMFNGSHNQASLLCHAESPYPQYWGSETWPPSRTDEMPDIALMSSSLVDPSILAFDSVMSLPVTGDAVHDLAAGNSRFSQHGQWGQNLSSADLYPTQEVQEILNSQFMQYNSPALALPHLPQDFNNFNKSFGTVSPIQHNRPVTSTNDPTSQCGGASMVTSSRAVTSINSMTSQYGGSSIVQNSMGMFAPTVPRGIVNQSGMGGGMNSNIGLVHLPKRHHAHSLASKAGGDVVPSDRGSGCGISTVPRASTFASNQKSSSSVLLPLADSAHIHKLDTGSEEPKMASFNPGPYVNNARVVPTQKHQQHDQQDALASSGMWMDNSVGKSSSVAIPGMGHRQQQAMSNASPVTSLGFDHRHHQAMSTSSAVTNLGFDHRHQQAMSNSSAVTNLGFERRHQQAMSNSSPVTNMGFEQRRQPSMSNSSPIISFGMEPSPKPPMGSSPIPTMGFEPRQQHQRLPSSSPNPIMGFEQRQQQSMNNSSPTPNLGFEYRQEPTTSTSPSLSNLSFEARQPHQQQAVSNAVAVSNLVFEPRRQQPNLTSNAAPIPNLARQQPAASNPRSAIPDSVESTSKWPSLRMSGGSEKAPMMMQQPETGTLKCALPRSSSASASTSTAVNANSANKRPLYPDHDKSQGGGSLPKKPLNKVQGGVGCSRLEEICAAAHLKLAQTSGRALGPALNTNLKPRARQGSANDPQSIAARVRRERISERLKVLQALIPNGDKVDMVTMLEKAINYVRCLELQIRMLKNDSLWPKALGPLPNTLQELLELAGPEFQDDKDAEETTPEKTKTVPEVIEFDGNQPSAEKE